MAVTRTSSKKPSRTAPTARAGAPAPDDAALAAAVRVLQAVDARMDALRAAGVVPLWRRIAGEEAVVAGVAHGLRDGDWLLPGPRWPGPPVVDEACGRALRVVQPGSPGAARAIHAVGVAQAARMRGDAQVAVTVLPEGALAQADIHGALNFAAVRRAPCLFVVTTGATLADLPAQDADALGAAWGLRAVTVDGTDARAVRDAVREAADQAREGGGPVLIRAVLGAVAGAVSGTAGAQPGTQGEDAAAAADAAEQAARRAAPTLGEATASLFDHVLTGPHPLLDAQRLGALPHGS